MNMLDASTMKQSEFDQQMKLLKASHVDNMNKLKTDQTALLKECQLATVAATSAVANAEKETGKANKALEAATAKAKNAVATAQKEAAKTTKQAVDALALAQKEASTAAAQAKQAVKTAQDATTKATTEVASVTIAAAKAKQEAAKAAAKALAEKKDLQMNVVALEKTMRELRKANQAHDDCEARIIALKKQQVN